MSIPSIFKELGRLILSIAWLVAVVLIFQRVIVEREEAATVRGQAQGAIKVPYAGR